MPVYDISGTPYTANQAVDIIIDRDRFNTSPETILVSATSEEKYLALVAFFATAPTIPLSGQDLALTALAWHNLMHWATQPLTLPTDSLYTPAFLTWTAYVFRYEGQTSALDQPYYEVTNVSVTVNSQPTMLLYLIFILRAIYRTSGLPAPVQVP